MKNSELLLPLGKNNLNSCLQENPPPPLLGRTRIPLCFTQKDNYHHCQQQRKKSPFIKGETKWSSDISEECPKGRGIFTTEPTIPLPLLSSMNYESLLDEIMVNTLSAKELIGTPQIPLKYAVCPWHLEFHTSIFLASILLALDQGKPLIFLIQCEELESDCLCYQGKI